MLFDTWFDRRSQRGRPIAELPIPAEIAAAGADAVDRYRDRASPGLSIRGPGQLVPGLGDGAGQRRGHRRGERARRSSGGPHSAAAVDAADHGLRRPAEKDLDGLDWPESIKLLQRNWIGRSTGAEVDFYIGVGQRGHRRQAAQDLVRGLEKRAAPNPVSPRKPGTRCCGSTPPGPTRCSAPPTWSCAPEHPFVERLTTPEQAEAVRAYCQQSARKSDLDRTDLAKEKTGVFTGSYAVNPVNGEPVPIWIADYVLASYGTGAIMAVPAHDTRDFEFARQFDLPIVAGR